jgi:23S rRNA G2069 N7-methylase RlmK/C1962 C5-methylase RlmI
VTVLQPRLRTAGCFLHSLSFSSGRVCLQDGAHCLPTSSSTTRLLASSSSSSSTSATATPRTSKKQATLQIPVVILKRSKQSKSFRNGNQLVFTKSIDRIDSPSSAQKSAPPSSLPSGTLVQVSVESDDPKGPPVTLGYGVYNPDSLYRVRFLCHRFLQTPLYQSLSETCTSPSQALVSILEHHLQVALKSRIHALNLQSFHLKTRSSPHVPLTDTFRWINGEGDHLSGLAIDVINRAVVVMSSAAWVQIHRESIIQAIQAVMPVESKDIIWRTTDNRLAQDGYVVDKSQGGKRKGSNKDDTREDSEESSDALELNSGSDSGSNRLHEIYAVHDVNEGEMIVSTENGVQYEVYPLSSSGGQKTSVYCDQRENRYSLAQLCVDKRVLDLCCYHGGFSLNAAVNGNATLCIGVDSSEEAIATCERNTILNNCQDKVSFIKSDVTEYMQEAYLRGAKFDVIVLDPPKLAPSVTALDKARRKYHSLNRDAIKLIDATNGGLLMTCTCSAAMTQKDGGRYFLEMVQGAALAAGRQVTLLRVSGAASCHTQSPISWPAGAYLTAALFYVHPMSTAAKSAATTTTTNATM